MDVIYFLALIGPLVFVHELGHFVVAKTFRIRVTKFSLGFGPVLLGKQWGETFYQIAWIPLGGFVKFLGDDPAEHLEEGDGERTFNAAAVWKRALVVFAGPAMSLALPVFCFFAVGLFMDELRPATVGQVFPDTPASRAGLQPGDRVLAIDDVPIHGFADLQRIVTRSPGEELAFRFRRGEEERTVRLTPARVRRARFTQLDISQREVGQVGVHNVFPAPVVGVPLRGSPAGEAGLETFDLVTSAAGRPVRRWIDLVEVLESVVEGSPVPVSYLRPERVGWPFADLWVQQPGRATVSPREGAGGAGDTGLVLGGLFVSHVLEGRPGDQAGLRVGDQIVTFDGRRVELWEELVERMNAAPEEPHELTFVRDGVSRTAELRLERRVIDDRYVGEVVDYRPGIGVYRVAVVDDPVPNPNRVTRAAVTAVDETLELLRLTLIGLLRLFQGRVSCQSIGGPIMLFELAGTAGRQGAGSFLVVLALISVNLGLVNLLPVPVLDGGHLVLLAAEAVRRRALSPRAREVTNVIGLVLLLLLLLVAIVNDVRRYWDWDDVRSLFQ